MSARRVRVTGVVMNGKCGRVLRRGAWLAGAALVVLAAPQRALAQCAVTTMPNTVTCATTTTTNTNNTDAATASSSDRGQFFAAGDVTAAVGNGATINGFGL